MLERHLRGAEKPTTAYAVISAGTAGSQQENGRRKRADAVVDRVPGRQSIADVAPTGGWASRSTAGPAVAAAALRAAP